MLNTLNTWPENYAVGAAVSQQLCLEAKKKTEHL